MDKSSHSEVEKFVMCERSHYYTYGLKIQGKSVSDALVIGNVGHVVLAKYYLLRQLGSTHEEAVREAFPLIRQEIAYYQPFDEEKMATDMIRILNNYWLHLAKYDDWEILHVEEAYDIQLTDDFTMPVKIDLVCRIPGHGIVALDHKFSRNFFDVDKLDLSPQLPKYWAALDALKIRVDELWYNELRTWTTKDNTADPIQRFRRTPVIMTPKKVVTIMREQIMAAKRISQLKQLPIEEWESKVLRNGLACNMCSFTTLCSADLEGRDSDLVRESFYEERTYR